MRNYLYPLTRCMSLLFLFLINISHLSVGQGLGPKTEARLQAAIENIQNDAAKPFVGGISAAVKVNGMDTWVGASGYAARNTDAQNNLLPGGTPLTPDMLLQIYSVTKTFTAALVLELAQEGRFGLDDAISKYLPLNQINPRLNSSVTLRQLLAHESGYSDYTLEQQLQIAVAAIPTRVWSPYEAISYTNQLAEPGTVRRYSNTNYTVLGALVEAVTQKPLEQHFRERFFTPLGLESMYLGVREPNGSRGVLASPHENISPFNPVFALTGQPLFPNAYTNISRFPMTAVVSLAFASGGIVSNAEDLAEWGTALFEGRATSQATLNQMLNSFSNTPDVNGNFLGYGVKILTRISDTETFWGHNGDAPGYRSVMAYQPERKVTLAVLSNFGGAEPYTIARALYQALAPAITSFSPQSGAPGSTITINGEGLSTTTFVIFNGIGADFKIISEDKIEAIVPATATTGRITLITAGGTVESNVDFTVLKRPQTITYLGATPGPYYIGSPVLLRATASSGLRVFYQLVSGPAEVAGSGFMVTGAGEIVIRAFQPGTDAMQPSVEYAPAEPVELRFIAEKAPLNIMFSPITDKILGDAPFAIEASVSSPAGISYPLPVTYSIVSGPATISGNMVTLTGVGAVTVRASQAGDANYNPATAEITFNVSGDNPNPSNCTIALTTKVTQAEPWYGMWGPFNGAGAIDLTVTGGTAPYTYRWNAGVITQDLSLASPGMYSVTVTDANGCMAMTTLYVGRKNDFLRVLSSHKDVSTSGGSDGAIDISVVGGVVPATFMWSNGATTEDLTGVPAGTYKVIVTDAFGRKATTTVVISEPGTPLSLSIAHQNVSAAGRSDGAIDLTVVGGTGPYTYRWNAGALTEDLSAVVAGDYTVTVTDAMGATAVATVRVGAGRAPVMMARKPAISDDLLAPAVGLTVYPNPVVNVATVNFSLAAAGNYTLDLFDIRGAKVKTLANGKASANKAVTVEVNVANYAKGVYLLKLVTDKGVSSKRLLIER